MNNEIFKKKIAFKIKFWLQEKTPNLPNSIIPTNWGREKKKKKRRTIQNLTDRSINSRKPQNLTKIPQNNGRRGWLRMGVEKITETIIGRSRGWGTPVRVCGLRVHFERDCATLIIFLFLFSILSFSLSSFLFFFYFFIINLRFSNAVSVRIPSSVVHFTQKSTN